MNEIRQTPHTAYFTKHLLQYNRIPINVIICIIMCSYTGAMWMSLGVAFSERNGGWNLQTIVNLEQRSDTGLPNASPVTASKPLYR